MSPVRLAVVLAAVVLPKFPHAAALPTVTQVSGYCPSAKWQPSGDLLACSSKDKPAALNILDLQGKVVSRVQGAAGPFNWSPDGKMIAAIDEVFEGRVVVLSSDGTGLRHLTAKPQKISRPTWTPNGADIWFSVTKDYPDKTPPQMFSVPLEGGDPVFRGEGSWPSWSSDGKLAYVVLGDRNAPDELWITTGGSAPVRRGTFPKVRGMGISQPPVWSPDGRWLAVAAAAEPGKSDHALYLLDTARPSGEFVSVATVSGDEFAWSANGAEILTPVVHQRPSKKQASTLLKIVAITVPGGKTRAVATPEPKCMAWFPADSVHGVAYTHSCPPPNPSTLRIIRAR